MAKGRKRKTQICSSCAKQECCQLTAKFFCKTCSAYTMKGLPFNPIIPECNSFYAEYCREFSGLGAEF